MLDASGTNLFQLREKTLISWWKCSLWLVAVEVFALPSSKGSWFDVFIWTFTETSTRTTCRRWKKLIVSIRVKGTRFDLISKVEKESLKIADFELSITWFDYFELYQTLQSELSLQRSMQPIGPEAIVSSVPPWVMVCSRRYGMLSILIILLDWQNSSKVNPISQNRHFSSFMIIRFV